MLETGDVAVALGERYSPAKEVADGVLLVELKDQRRTPVEVRIEPEVVRLFAWMGPAPQPLDELRHLMRANEGLISIRFAVENGDVVVRGDIPIPLWSPTELAAALREIEHVLDTGGGGDA